MTTPATPQRSLLHRSARKLVGDSASRSRLKSIGHLVTGNAMNALMMLASTTIAARTLGAESYGVLALILTIGRFTERVVRFESWQPLIRYAAQEEVEGDKQRLSKLFLYGLMLDVTCSLLAGGVTILAGKLLAPVLGLEEEQAMIAVYALAIAVNIRGMSTGALRLAGNFRLLAYIQSAASTLRIIMALTALYIGADLMTFVIMWTISQMCDSLLFLFMGFRALRKLEIPNPLTASPVGLRQQFPGFLRFAFSTNLSGTMRTLTQEADTLLVGAFAGKSAAGFYHLAKRMAKASQLVGEQMQAVLYPDMARMWAKADFKAFRRTAARVQLALGVIGITILVAAVVIGEILIKFVFGQEFAETYPLLIAQLVAVVLILHAAPSRSALLAMNKPTYVLGTAIASTIVFFGVAFATMPHFGALGANFAHIAFALLTAGSLDYAFWRGSKEKIACESAPS